MDYSKMSEKELSEEKSRLETIRTEAKNEMKKIQNVIDDKACPYTEGQLRKMLNLKGIKSEESIGKLGN